MQATYEVTEFRQQNADSVTFVSDLHKPLCFVARAILLVLSITFFSLYLFLVHCSRIMKEPAVHSEKSKGIKV